MSLRHRRLSSWVGKRQDRRGQSLVELALVLPVLLVLLAAALDLGRVFYATISLNNAAREGAMQAAEDPTSYLAGQPCDTTTNKVVCRVQLEAKGTSVAIDPTDITMTCSVTGCPGQAGSSVTVAVAGEFQLLTPLLAAIFGGQDLDLSAQATAQVKYLPTFGLVTPPPVPTVGFTATNVLGEAPLTVTFTDTSTGDPFAWSWDFGDGGSSTEQNPTYTYTTPGTYDVTLVVINSTDSSTLTKNGYIEVQTNPTATATPTPTPTTSPTPTPDCHPPNVVGMSVNAAQIAIQGAGFTPVLNPGLSTGPKNQVMAQQPDHTECIGPGDDVQITYRPN